MLIVRRKPPVAQPVVHVSPLRRRIVQSVQAERPAAVVRAAPKLANSAIAREELAREVREKINAELKLIATAEAAIDDAQESIQNSYLMIEKLLRSCNLTTHTNGVYLAEIVEQFTRQTRDIDPQKYRLEVTNDTFWSSISVNLGKASQHLSEKEINKISTVVPGKSTGHVLKVKKLEPKRRSRE